jgi:hypothetical protein
VKAKKIDIVEKTDGSMDLGRYFLDLHKFLTVQKKKGVRNRVLIVRRKQSREMRKKEVKPIRIKIVRID